MHKFIGVEPTSKTWLIWTIFALKAGFVPVSIVIGFIFINSVTAEPNIPVLQIVAGVVEFIWTLLFFYIYIYLPSRVNNGQDTVNSKTRINLTLWVLGLLSLALVTVVVAMSVLLARIPSSVVGISCEDPECVHCPAAVFYGTWVWLGFKYLDVIKLVVVLAVTFKK